MVRLWNLLQESWNSTETQSGQGIVSVWKMVFTMLYFFVVSWLRRYYCLWLLWQSVTEWTFRSYGKKKGLRYLSTALKTKGTVCCHMDQLRLVKKLLMFFCGFIFLLCQEWSNYPIRLEDLGFWPKGMILDN